MIEKPEIGDEKIITALNDAYSVQASHIEFLPIGNDSSAFSYRVETENGNAYFLKLKRRLSNLAGLVVPRFLKDHGVEQVVAPLATNARQLTAEIDEFALILYPFVVGQEAMQVGMSNSQWMEFGSVLKQIHFTKPSPNILHYVNRETFIPKWSGTVKELDEQVNAREYADPYQKELAIFWKEKRALIQMLVERTESIGKQLQQSDLEFVLCHADIHTANIIITPKQEMFIVDWDDTLLAPKERDLMFVLGDDAAPTREEQLFFDGYGKVKINQLALAYYRYEWCIQEIGDFGERILLTKDTGENTKQNALKEFIKLFAEDDVVEGALRTPMT